MRAGAPSMGRASAGMGIEQIGFVEGDRDGPIELPISLNRFASNYVSRRVTSRREACGDPPAESVRVGAGS
jgi:hypothetical protein